MKSQFHQWLQWRQEFLKSMYKSHHHLWSYCHTDLDPKMKSEKNILCPCHTTRENNFIKVLLWNHKKKASWGSQSHSPLHQYQSVLLLTSLFLWKWTGSRSQKNLPLPLTEIKFCLQSPHCLSSFQRSVARGRNTLKKPNRFLKSALKVSFKSFPEVFMAYIGQLVILHCSFFF